MTDNSKDSVDEIVKFTEMFSKEADKFEKIKRNTELPAKVGGGAAAGLYRAYQLREIADTLRSFNQNLYEIGGASIAGGVAADFAAPIVLYSVGAARNGLRALGHSCTNIATKLENKKPVESFNNTNKTTYAFFFQEQI